MALAKNTKIAFIGGHSTPAFAVLDKFLEEGYSNVVWISEKHNQKGNKNPSAEYQTITTKYKIPFINFISGKLIKPTSLADVADFVLNLIKIFLAFIFSFFYILDHKINVVISFGGFLAVPLSIVAKFLGKKVYTHEQTIATGLATRIIAKFADKVFVSWEESKKSLKKTERVILTGNPLRKEIYINKNKIKNLLKSDLPVIHITGGNQGANEINKRIFPIIPELLNFTNVIHQTGNSSVTGDFQKGMELKTSLDQMKTNGKYLVYDYIGPDLIGEVFSLSSLEVSRGGANTTMEFIALDLYSLIIPIAFINYDEQTKNADYLESLGIAKKLVQNESLTPYVLLKEIKEKLNLIQNDSDFKTKLNANFTLAKTKIRQDAQDKIYSEITQ